jgi:uracil-DNA glycosylase
MFGGLLTGIHPGWHALIEENPDVKAGFRAGLSAVLASRAQGQLVVPSVQHIFEAFRFVDPLDVRAVIVGQDPYHTVLQVRSADGSSAVHAQAQGLCFSCNPAVQATQPSLVRIHGAVAKTHAGHAPPLHSLRFWASQGVLLLNRSLTTVQGKAGAHLDGWKDFTGALVKHLCLLRAKEDTPLVFMLWGGKAKTLSSIVRASSGDHPETFHPVFEWGHPSPLGDNKQPPEKKFVNCDHFRQLNDRLHAQGRGPIDWVETSTIVACDGACKRNGKPGAAAGYGVGFMAGPLAGVKFYGPVAPSEYHWADPAEPLHGFVPGGVTVAPTNNRGEYLAACYLLLAIARAGLTAPVEIVCDSNLFIQTMTDWLPKWKRNGIASRKKNYDLICIAERLLAIARQTMTVSMVHIRSHQAEPEYPAADAPLEDRMHYVRWRANWVADVMAGNGVDAAGLTIISPKAFWLPE